MNGFSEVQAALPGRQREECRPIAREKSLASRPVMQPAEGRWSLYGHRWTTRRVLLTLTDDELRDIGLDYRQARIEAMKPFWRA